MGTMKTIKINLKQPIMSCLFLCVCCYSIAQYAPPPPPPPGYGPPPRERRNDDAGLGRPSGYISINFGLANPEGNYASMTGGGYGGYALPGDIFHISIGVPINRSNFGLAFMFGSINNQYDINSYCNNNGVSPALDQNYYAQNCVMGGLYLTIPIGILSIDGRLMIGGLFGTLPEIDYQYDDAQGNNWQYDTEPSNSSSLVYDAGIGARVLLARFGRRKLCAMINVDYMYSNIPFSTQQDQYETPSTGPNAGITLQNSYSPSVTGNLPFELLNVTFGLGYQL